MVNAILSVCRTGIAWAYLPHDFPPYQTVYDYYAKWDVDGTTDTCRRGFPAETSAGRCIRARATTTIPSIAYLIQ
ncbi:transposase [Amycolatopsis pigmentata]|uniref:Transposase n=1 Tax=Amycolatopsis pigmentata TaxID=450801 RepID=A0ABW5G429_9PSEU